MCSVLYRQGEQTSRQVRWPVCPSHVLPISIMGFRRSRRTNVGRPSNDIDSIGMNEPVAATEKNEMGNVAARTSILSISFGARANGTMYSSTLSQPLLCDRPSCVFLRGFVLLISQRQMLCPLGAWPLPSGVTRRRMSGDTNTLRSGVMRECAAS